MKLSELTEGLIKLPGAVKPLHQFFLKTFFEILGSEIDDLVNDEDYDTMVESYHRLLRHYSVSEPSRAAKRAASSKHEFTTKVKLDVSQEYFDRFKREYDKSSVRALKNASVNFVVAKNDHPDLGPRESALFDPSTNTIIVSIEKNDLNFEKLIGRLALCVTQSIVNELDEMLGDLEHELTHAVQYEVMYHLHSKQIDDAGVPNPHEDAKLPDGKNHPWSKDSYFNQDIENHPWIRTSLRAIESKLKKATSSEKKAIVRKYTCSDMTTAELNKQEQLPADRSEFFAALKRHDMNKWKRTVKYFTKELDL